NAPGSQFRHCQAQCSDLFRSKRDVPDLVLRLEFDERRKRHTGTDGEHVKRGLVYLCCELCPFTENDVHGKFQRIEKLRKIGWRSPTARPATDALASHFSDRADPGLLQNEELERRVVHRKDGTHRTSRLLAGPHASAIPCLERNPNCNEAEFSLTGLEKLYILCRPFSGQPQKLKIWSAGR